MKTWTNADIVTVDVVATENQPCTEIAVDDLINGVFTFGKRDNLPSGSMQKVDYTPTDGR